MKHNKHFLGIVLAAFSLIITSCSSLLPNMSRNRRDSSNDEEQSSLIDKQTSFKEENSTYQEYSNSSNGSTKHKHSWGNWVTIEEATCMSRGIQQRECTTCQMIETRETSYGSHQWEDMDYVSPTCLDFGYERKICNYCGSTQAIDLPPLGHQWVDVEVIQESTCTSEGIVLQRCTLCAIEQTITISPSGHNMELVNYQEPEIGTAPVRVYKCANCNITYFNLKATDVSDASKSHLVFLNDDSEEVGAHFFGRPIGNDVPLNDSGDPDADNHETIFNENQLGDYFEFVFQLNAAQASLLKDCYLYCDATPAQWMRNNNMDFFARDPSHTEWTQGVYISGEHKGEEILDYRYALYVDDEIVYFDPNIKNPVTSDNRAEFTVPYKFSLHAGLNKIRLHMAGGYRSLFYNFTFRSIEEESIFDGWLEDVNTVMPEQAEGDAFVKRYIKANSNLVKYVIDVKTANMTLSEGSSWKTDPSTGYLKLGRDGYSCSFSFALDKGFEGKAYQVGYMDAYNSNKTKLLYYQTDNTPNIELTVNDVVTDISPLSNLTFEEAFGDESDGSNSLVKEVEIGDVILKTYNVINFKRVKTMNLTISQFVFIGVEHEHNWVTGNKIGDTSLKEINCQCGEMGYELAIEDTLGGSQTPQKLKEDAIWNILGIQTGLYEIHVSGCAASSTLSQEMSSGGVGRYQWRINEGDYINPLAGTYAYFGFGTGTDIYSCKWSSTCNTIFIDNTANYFEMHYTGLGYSLFINAIRLIKIA